MSTPTSLRGPFLVLAGALCFSGSGFLQAVAPEGATPMVLTALRMLVGSAALYVWCCARGKRPGIRGWELKPLILSSLSLLFCQVFFFQGLKLVGVAAGTVASIGVMPIAAALLGWIILKERPAKAWYPATALAIAGLVMLNSGMGGEADLRYIAFPLATGFGYAAYLVFSKPLLEKHEPEAVMVYLCLVSGVCIMPALAFFPTAWIVTPQGLLVTLGLGIVTSAMAFSFLLAGLRITPTPTASTLALAEPLCAALLGLLCLGETLTPVSGIGLACMLGSILLLIFLSPEKEEA